jgi:EAL domain-containing protein (putative c-di-GMP-specific phosphodiesterase class I)/sensor domain CHASE-containing protein
MGIPAAHCRRAAIGAFHARPILVALLLVGFATGSRAAIVIGNAIESPSKVRALDEVNGASSDQLAKLTAAALALAVANDTNEFVSRPNLPYISAHYSKEQLAAEQIDTVLIINTRGEPLFWRRLNQGRNRGFPDARAFLAELPKLPAPGIPGMPGIAAPAMLDSGPMLVVAMPIYGVNGKGRSHGWLIVARSLVATAMLPFGGSAQSQIHALYPVASTVAAPLVARQSVGVATRPTFFTARSAIWITLLIIISGVVAVTSGSWSGLFAKANRLRVGVRPIDTAGVSAWPGAACCEQRLTQHSLNKLAAEPKGGAENIAGPVRNPLQDRISAANAVFRYHPQIDLRNGQVAGVEALLCVPGSSGYRPATELAADIEKAGLGLQLFECRLQEACRRQRTWLRNVGHNFAVGVPVSQRMLASAALLPLAQRVLAQHEIAPALLELEIEEAALSACSLSLRTLTKVYEAGISIALDGFNANHANLRLLAILPIAKLRVDPWRLLRIADRVAEAQVFAGILGAARGLGIAVCATGVASADMLAAVLRQGRPLAQGMAVAAALDGPEFLERLRGNCVDTVTIRRLDLECPLLPTGSSAPEPFREPRNIPGSRSRTFSAAATCQ